MIKVQELTKRYDGFLALDRVSFEIGRGEVVGFLGPNGAGKSTTLRILTGYLSPTEGDAWLDGRSVLSADEDYRHSIGYLPEGAPSYPEMRVVDYLDFVAKVRRIHPKERTGSVERVVETCGLGSMASRAISTLSKGYRQRVGIAQAMIHQPSVLILDEPTSGLDPNQLEDILAVIKRYGEERTVLFSSHILSEVQAVCSRVLILNHGQLVADDTPDELSARLAGDQYQLSVAGADGAVIKGQVMALSCVKECEILSETAAGVTLTLRLESGADRGMISRLVVDSEWSLLEFKETNVNLEEVFRTLTGRAS